MKILFCREISARVRLESTNSFGTIHIQVSLRRYLFHSRFCLCFTFPLVLSYHRYENHWSIWVWTVFMVIPAKNNVNHAPLDTTMSYVYVTFVSLRLNWHLLLTFSSFLGTPYIITRHICLKPFQFSHLYWPIIFLK